MNNIFSDTNIIIDVLEKRQPFYKASANILQLAEEGTIKLFVSPLTMINVIYVCRKALGIEQAIKQTKGLREYIDISPMTVAELDKALSMKGSDVEDNLQYCSAESANCDIIITRNAKDFPKSGDIKILTPEQFLETFEVDKSHIQ